MSTLNDGKPHSAERLFLNTRQAAHRMCMSVRKLEAMRAEGKGPPFRRHGRLVFYHVDDLEIWSRSTGGGQRAGQLERAGDKGGDCGSE